MIGLTGGLHKGRTMGAWAHAHKDDDAIRVFHYGGASIFLLGFSFQRGEITQAGSQLLGSA